MRLDHINIKAPADLLEREKTFFCEVLGLREGDRPDFASRGYWLYAGDRAVVHLSQSAGSMGDAGNGALDHVAFRSSDPQSLIGALDERNIEYSTARLPELDMTQIFFRTPSNIRIEVNFVSTGTD